MCSISKGMILIDFNICSIGSVTVGCSSQGRSYAATVAGIFGDTAVGKLNVEEETRGEANKRKRSETM